MMWTIAFGGINDTSAQTDASTAVMTDQTVTLDASSNLLLPTPLLGMWYYGLGNTLSRVRISAPKFRPIARPLIRPIEQANNPSSRPIFMEAWRHPLLFNAVESISMLRSNAAPAGGERNFILATFGDGNRNAPQGDMYTLRFVTSFTPTANAWSASGSFSFDDQLQAGRYSIIGFDLFAAGGVAARLIFPGAPVSGLLPYVRPGIIMSTGDGMQGVRYFRYGYMGEYGQFESFALPQVEVIETAATANPEGYFDVVMVRMGARAA